MQIILMVPVVYFSIPIVMLIFWDRCKAYALSPWEAFKFVLLWPMFLKGE